MLKYAGTTKLMFSMGIIMIIMYNHAITIYIVPNDTRILPHQDEDYAYLLEARTGEKKTGVFHPAYRTDPLSSHEKRVYGKLVPGFEPREVAWYGHAFPHMSY